MSNPVYFHLYMYTEHVATFTLDNLLISTWIRKHNSFSFNLQTERIIFSTINSYTMITTKICISKFMRRGISQRCYHWFTIRILKYSNCKLTSQ
jgi:hypothetical protein